MRPITRRRRQVPTRRMRHKRCFLGGRAMGRPSALLPIRTAFFAIGTATRANTQKITDTWRTPPETSAYWLQAKADGACVWRGRGIACAKNTSQRGLHETRDVFLQSLVCAAANRKQNGITMKPFNRISIAITVCAKNLDG